MTDLPSTAAEPDYICDVCEDDFCGHCTGCMCPDCPATAPSTVES